MNNEDSGELACTPNRVRLSDERPGLTHEFRIITVKETYNFKLTEGLYPDKRLGELFLAVAKEGSMIRGTLDALMISLSIGLQHGVPLSSYTTKFRHMHFSPEGYVNGAPQALLAHLGMHGSFQAKSPVDYLAAYLDWRYPDGVLQTAESSALSPVKTAT